MAKSSAQSASRVLGSAEQSDPTLKKWYNEINRKFFKNKLPAEVLVRYAAPDGKAKKTIASADVSKDGVHKYEIRLNPRLKTMSLTLSLSALAHEMAHVATELKDDHGPAFDRWFKKLSNRGLFKKGALRKDITLF